MSLSRRALLGNLGGSHALTGAWIAARGREELIETLGPDALEVGQVPEAPEGEIRISSNENPLGPGDRALEALKGAFELGYRYPTNTSPSMADLRAILAETTAAQPVNVVLGAGSGELLKNGVHCFTSPTRHLVTASPTYNQPRSVAQYLGHEVRSVPVNPDDGKLDLDGMAAESDGAGLVFVCNPNNPTSTVHTANAIAEFVETVHRRSPETVIHFDEAYHEYVTDPGYTSAVAMALETPNVFVTRTFSKCYGMAGMRIGYGVGHEETMRRLGRYALTFNTNTPGQIAAYAAAQDTSFVAAERARNSEAKAFTVGFFKGAGYEVYDSQTNFIFVNIGRPAADFRAGCSARGVRVGRDFPPYEKTHARISIGTMDEMEHAVSVFRTVLEG